MYKLLYNNITIDVIDIPVYCTYLPNGRKLRTDKMSANCILSSDSSTVYHIAGTPEMPSDYKTVEIVQIDLDEYNYLQSQISNGAPIDEDVINTRKIKIEEMSAESERVIHAGTDITLSDGQTCHFSFSDQDQFQIGFLATAAKNAQMLESMGMPTGETGKDYPWHADDGDCIFYSRADMIVIGTTMLSHIQYHNSYFHALRNYVNDLSNPLVINDITYGIEIPKMYWGEVYKNAQV